MRSKEVDFLAKTIALNPSILTLMNPLRKSFICQRFHKRYGKITKMILKFNRLTQTLTLPNSSRIVLNDSWQSLDF